MVFKPMNFALSNHYNSYWQPHHKEVFGFQRFKNNNIITLNVAIKKYFFRTIYIL